MWEGLVGLEICRVQDGAGCAGLNGEDMKVCRLPDEKGGRKGEKKGGRMRVCGSRICERERSAGLRCFSAP